MPSEEVVKLKEYLERLISELVVRFDQRAEAAEKAVAAALAATDKATAAAFSAAKEAVAQAFSAAEKANSAALVAAKEAVLKAEITTEKRLEGMNEVREQLRSQAETFVPKNQYNAEIIAIKEVMTDLKTRLDTSTGKSSGLSAGWGVLVGVIGMLAAFISVAMKVWGK